MTEPLYVVSLPSGSFTAKNEVKEYVSALNASILRGSNYVHPVDVRLIIGDPNYAFTDTVAEMLVEIGILTKEPVKNKHGKQKKLQGKELPEEQRVLWHYAWGEKSFNDCSEEQLLTIGWDLRRHDGFVTVCTVVERAVTSTTQDDSSGDEDFSTLEDDFEQGMLRVP